MELYHSWISSRSPDLHITEAQWTIWTENRIKRGLATRAELPSKSLKNSSWKEESLSKRNGGQSKYKVVRIKHTLFVFTNVPVNHWTNQRSYFPIVYIEMREVKTLHSVVFNRIFWRLPQVVGWCFGDAGPQNDHRWQKWKHLEWKACVFCLWV